MLSMHTGFTGGGAFKAAATSDAFNHGHASAMAHAAAGRRAVASALGSVKAFKTPAPLTPPGVTTGGAMPPPTPTPPGMGATPPGMGAVPGMGPMPGGALPAGHAMHKGNFKALIAHQVQARLGIGLTHNSVQAAIGRLGQRGVFTPAQAAGLQAHTGPLQQPPGANTMSLIAKEAVSPSNGPGGMSGGMSP